MSNLKDFNPDYLKNLYYRCRGLGIVEVGLDLLRDRIAKRPISPNYRGLCPFHRETRPSFYLKVDWNTFLCHGCGAQGTPIYLPFALNGLEEGLGYLEKKLDFSRTDKLALAILSQNLDEGLGRFGTIIVNDLPFDLPEYLTKGLSNLEDDMVQKMIQEIHDKEMRIDELENSKRKKTGDSGEVIPF